MTTRRPIELMDSPEHRSIPIERIEMRSSQEDDNELVLEGYASTFDEYEMYGGPSAYGWTERIDPRAFDVTLRERPDLHLLINHAGMPLARTKSGNLDLVADSRGLKVVARLDKRDPEVQSLAVKMERGDMDEMSFAFRVKAQEWRAAPGFEEDNQSYRTITEVSLHKGDVSVVNWGANPTTSVGLRSVTDALKVLAEADASEFAEVRSDEQDLMIRAATKLTESMVKAPAINIENVIVRSETDEAPEGETSDEVDEEQVELEPVFADSERIEELSARIAQLEAIIAGTDEVEGDESEEESDEVEEEVEELVAARSRVDEALAAQGILPEKLSLAAALAFED